MSGRLNLKTGLVALFLGAAMINVAFNKRLSDITKNYEFSADIIGNRDGKVQDNERQSLDTLVSKAREYNVKNAYLLFIIPYDGKTFSTNLITVGDSLPYINPDGLRFTEYPGISQDEMIARADLGLPLPVAKVWKKEDFYYHFGAYEINQKREISAVYILTEKGMKKQSSIY
jgi:hypothetical protein